MRINSNRQNRTVHAATVDHEVVLRLIAERVAEKAGTTLERGGVTWRAYFSTRDTSTGVRTDVGVEIIEDHTEPSEAA